MNVFKEEVVFQIVVSVYPSIVIAQDFPPNSTYSNASNKCRYRGFQSSRHPAVSKILRCTVLITSEVEYFYDLWYTNHLCLGSSFLICELPTFAHFPFKLSCACFSWNDCLYFLHQLLVSYVPWEYLLLVNSGFIFLC